MDGEQGIARERAVEKVRVTIGSGGRINLPARQRKVLDLRKGDEVVVGVENGGLRIESRDVAISRVQQKVRRRLGEGRSLSKELIAGRREEARREARREGEDDESAEVEGNEVRGDEVRGDEVG